MRTILLPASALLLGAGLALACKEEKMGVEKRAEELALSASLARSAASAAPPDPAEIKYKERKSSLERTVTNMKADEARLMAKDPTTTPGMLRHYYESGPEGDKVSKELEAKRKKDGDDGYRIKKAKIVDTRIAGSMDEGDIQVQEEASSKGTAGCLLYDQKWKWTDDKWVLNEQKSVKKVDCD
jgi:hypothetical protein